MQPGQKLSLLFKRILAEVIDSLILYAVAAVVFVVLFALLFLLAGLSLGRFEPDGIGWRITIYTLFAVGLGAILYLRVREESRKLASPGAQAMGLQIYGIKPTIFNFILREVTKYLFFFLPIIVIGFIFKESLMGLYVAIGCAFSWIAIFILSSNAQFPHDLIFGSQVLPKTEPQVNNGL